MEPYVMGIDIGGTKIAYVMGIDIGGTKIAAGIIGSDGMLRRQLTCPTPVAAGADAILQAVIALAREVIAEAHATNCVIQAVGVGTAGHVDHNRGVIMHTTDTLPGWSGLPLAELLAHALQLPVTIDNDVNMMALGESTFGTGATFRHALYITVGTGVGGALLWEGQLWRGIHHTAGEIGHLLIDHTEERRCYCGQVGHLEAYTSGPALMACYQELTGDPIRHDLRVIAARAETGDAVARQVIINGARLLGRALGGILNFLDPEALVVGGGVAELGDLWWRPFVRSLRADLFPGPGHIEIRRAQLGPTAVLIGAGWLALHRQKVAQA
jgi:glucokinase